MIFLLKILGLIGNVFKLPKVLKDKFKIKYEIQIIVVLLLIIGGLIFYIYSEKKKNNIVPDNITNISIEDNKLSLSENRLLDIDKEEYVPQEGRIDISFENKNKEADSIKKEIEKVMGDSSLTPEIKLDKLGYYSNLLIKLNIQSPITYTIKSKGFTFRPFFGGGYSGEPDLIFGAKLIYYSRYGGGIGFGKRGGGIVVSRHIDDIIKWFKNSEIYVELGLTYKAKLMLSGGLLITF